MLHLPIASGMALSFRHRMIQFVAASKVRTTVSVIRRTFRDILDNSLERIATNILVSRLKKLVKDGMLTSEADPNPKQRKIYSLTEKSIALLPALIALGVWGRRLLPVTPDLAI